MSSTTIRSARVMRPIARATVSSARWRTSAPSSSMANQATVRPVSMASCPRALSGAAVPTPSTWGAGVRRRAVGCPGTPRRPGRDARPIALPADRPSAVPQVPDGYSVTASRVRLGPPRQAWRTSGPKRIVSPCLNGTSSPPSAPTVPPALGHVADRQLRVGVHGDDAVRLQVHQQERHAAIASRDGCRGGARDQGGSLSAHVPSRGGPWPGIGRQRKDGEALASRLGWPIVQEYCDNDLSASKYSRKPGRATCRSSRTCMKVPSMRWSSTTKTHWCASLRSWRSCLRCATAPAPGISPPCPARLMSGTR
jgi:hypothetical protein